MFFGGAKLLNANWNRRSFVFFVKNKIINRIIINDLDTFFESEHRKENV